MIRYLLDTNIISEPTRPKPNKHVIDKINAHTYEIALTSISWHELLYGLYRLSESDKQQFLEAYMYHVVLPSMPILEYDQHAAEWHALERTRLVAKGETPPFSDGQIAGIAATQGLILVTRNTSDFERFKGLHIENWFDAE